MTHIYIENVASALVDGSKDRIDNLLRGGETRGAFIREAIMSHINRRESEQEARRLELRSETQRLGIKDEIDRLAREAVMEALMRR